MERPPRVRAPLICGLVAGILFGSAELSAGEIYRWVDARGQVHFTTDLSQVPKSQRVRASDEASGKVERPSSGAGVINQINTPPPRRRGPSRRSTVGLPAAVAPSADPGPSQTERTVWANKVKTAQRAVTRLENKISSYKKKVFRSNSSLTRHRYQLKLEAAKDSLRGARRAAREVEQDARRAGLEWGDLR